MQPRRYSDQEVGQILSRAATLQAGAVPADGATLQELQRIAEEVGIDPTMIARAATELDGARRNTASANSNSAMIEQSVPGELSDEAWDRMVTAVQAHCGGAGKTDANGGKREWTGGSDTSRLMLSATNRNGQVELKLLGDVSGTVALTASFGVLAGIFLPLIPVIVQTKTGVLGPIVVAMLSAIALVVAVMVTRAIIRAQRLRHNADLGGLMDRLTEIASTTPSIEDRLVRASHSDAIEPQMLQH